jgi:hypothetical protein
MQKRKRSMMFPAFSPDLAEHAQVLAGLLGIDERLFLVDELLAVAVVLHIHAVAVMPVFGASSSVGVIACSGRRASGQRKDSEARSEYRFKVFREWIELCHHH